ncbi:40-kDa huntingtin-associated protein-like [Pollicipes pollicipes]|uniref:40-kDa huntingtin-associated protein-like n=1 Tax=Pollicipes pollicipes TaxID=41117 RepID=UPI001885725A|nr:40-kDa huntingtin-associated protein-like [Pollicipes pollicipes]
MLARMFRLQCELVCEVSQLLLLLAMEPPAAQRKPAHTRLLESFGGGETTRQRGGHIGESLRLLLQSLTLAVRRRHLPALYALEGDLRPLLDDSQRQLLSRLVQQVETRQRAER